MKFVSFSFLLLLGFIRLDASSDTLRVSNDSSYFIAPDAVQQSLFTEGLLPTISSGDPIDSIQYYIAKAKGVMEEIRKTQNYISNLNDASMFQLPVGLSNITGGLNFDIGIYAMRLMPTHAEVDVFLQFTMPQNNQTLTFHGKRIKFTRAGGIVGDARLALVGDYGINFGGDKLQLILRGNLKGDATYATIDCDGFREMGLDAEVKFSRDMVVPEDAAGNVLASGNVAASFKTTITNWNDLVVQIALPSFQLASMPGTGFKITDAVFDFSDLRNAPGVKFPAGYTNSSDPLTANLWRGIYVRELAVSLPQEFKSKKGTRTSFKGFDLLLDNQGFSGKVEAENLMTINEGDMSGWQFSLTKISVELQKNQLRQAGFSGDIIIPVSDERTPFHYDAVISSGGKYAFTVQPGTDLTFPLWQAGKVEIYQASTLQITVADRKFKPKAVLHGKMTIKGKLSEGGQGVELADIRFENLQIQSEKPYMSLGTFSFGSEAGKQAMAGFPVSITSIGMRTVSPEQTAIDFTLKLNLVGEDKSALAADAGLSIIGQVSSEGGVQRWKYHSVAVRDISIDVNGGAFKFKGRLVFYKNDAVYGDGFNGMVDAEFVDVLKIKSSAIFGSVNSNRYWYVDALAEFTPGIALFPGINMIGFGGGAYSGMRIDVTGRGSALGSTASGIVYIPDAKMGLGLKAIVKIATVKEQAFNGDLTFEIAFRKTGGVSTISLNGNGFFATPGLDKNIGKLKEQANKMADAVKVSGAKLMDEAGSIGTVVGNEATINNVFGPIGEGSGDKGQISARMFIQYDFDNKELHGNFSANLNVAGGILKGGGDAVLHFAPGVWYVYIGTPDQRFKISLGIGSVRANADTYFMVGSKIPGSPPPPSEVISALGGGNYNYMNDMNAIGAGAGFAFGSKFSVSTGDMTFLIFYASFSAGAGFDIMIKDYGDTYCEGSTKRIGINGWYANGQAYAYFTGAVGVKVKVFGKKKKFEIFNGSAAALLQAKLPNPFWMKGAVGGSYSVLGGIVSGRFNCEIELGQECKLIDKNKDDNMLEGMTTIAQMTPGKGEKEVSVFNAPQVVFNMPVGKTFVLTDDKLTKSFRVKLDSYTLSVDSKTISGNLEWNATQDVVAFRSLDILPGLKEVKASVQISYEELVSGMWKAVTENGVVMTEKMETSFTTAAAPTYVPLENVSYSYPVVNQLNFYKDESTEGYIQLRQGQPELFKPGADWKQIGRFTSVSGKKVEFTYSYNNGLITFVIPPGMELDKVYSFELIDAPVVKTGAVDRNVSAETKTVAEGVAAGTDVKSKKAQGKISDLQEKNVFSAYFRTSKYAKFGDKVAALAISKIYVPIIEEGNFYDEKLYGYFSGSEYYDEIEVLGTKFSASKPLVQIETYLANNVHYTQRVEPIVYIGYPLDGTISITSRTTSVLGVPPVKAMDIDQNVFTQLTDDNIANGYAAPTITTSRYVFDLALIMYNDFLDLRSKVASKYVNAVSVPQRMLDLMGKPYPRLDNATYTFRLSYTMPGTGKVTTVKDVSRAF